MTSPLRLAKDIALRLNCSEQNVRNLASSGALKSVRFQAVAGKKGKNGRSRMSLRFRDEDVEEFIREHLSGGPR